VFERKTENQEKPITTYILHKIGRIHICKERKPTGEYNEAQEKKRERKREKDKTLPRTSVVLLLLVIVSEFPLTLCCHPTLRLHHLFHLVGTTLVPLGGIEPLGIARRGHSVAIKLADRMVSLRATTHTRVCQRDKSESRSGCHPCPQHTVVGVGPAHHHGHRISPRSIPQLPALDEIVDRTIDLW
jgi:hypothetical protein